MVSPAAPYVDGRALFTIVIAGFCVIGISRLSVASGASVDEAVTLFVRFPLPGVGEPFASSSACVKVCVAVHVVVAAGASVVATQLVSSLSLSSESEIPVIVTFPVFVTK